MATSLASAAARPQVNNRLHVVRVRNKLRRLSTVDHAFEDSGLKQFCDLVVSAVACMPLLAAGPCATSVPFASGSYPCRSRLPARYAGYNSCGSSM